MPVISDRVVLRAWRHKNEPDKIHFVVARADGSSRRLWVGEDHFLYEILNSHLLAIGYTGPANGQNDPEEALDDTEATH
ncbi:hypothetical protein [Micromonospora wenchangensis]|uniref:hypothetical protein n=1 Tax=Micromonospora wenchangensis TaxID=1185415 RepID=UPI0038030A30